MKHKYHSNSYISLARLLTLFALCTYNASTYAADFCDDKYYISQTFPNQARWDMCWEHRNFNGISLHHVHYTPPQQSRQMILQRAELAQVHVPYDDNESRFHDITDYGFGGNLLQTLQAEDCHNGLLIAFSNRPVICQQVVENDSLSQTLTGVLQGQSLSLFSVSQIAAYNYIPRWRFADDGSMDFSVGATGSLQRFGIDPTRGWLIAENKVGVSHEHNFFWRLDFDLGGYTNQDYVEELEFTKESNKVVKKTIMLQQEASSTVDPSTAKTWVIASKSLKNNQGLSKGYEIQFNQTLPQTPSPAIEPFNKYDLYLVMH